MYFVSKFYRVNLSILLILSPFVNQAQSSAAQEAEDERVVKLALLLSPELRELLNSDNWLENLTNPALTSEADIRRTQMCYEKILERLSLLESQYTLPETLKLIEKLCEYFIIFAGTRENSTLTIANELEEKAKVYPKDRLRSKSDIEKKVLYAIEFERRLKRVLRMLALNNKRELIDLKTTTDPAIVELREKVGLTAPEGFVYLRYYPDKSFMPKVIQSAFESENTKAVTFLCRYIAIVSKMEISDTERHLKRRILPKTVSHELVHAYINSTLGLKAHSKLPLWFREGCAIYFSGSGGTQSVVDFVGGVAYTTSDPVEYKEYKIIFKYLESNIGKENLYPHVKRAIEGHETNEMLVSVGAVSFEDLSNDAKAWHRTKENIKWGILLLIVIISLCLIWRKLPAKTKDPSF